MYACRIVLELSKEPRFTGTEGERRAREIIVSELKTLGLSPSLEGFKVKTYKILEESLEVTKPPLGEVECSGIGFSGSTGEEGVEGRIAYVESGDRALMPSDSGWVALAAVRPSPEDWEFLAKRASALVISESSPHRKLSRLDVPYEWLEDRGQLPAVYVKYNDAVRLLEAERVRVVLRQEYSEVETYNILTEIEGSKYPDEVIMVTAHYDSERGVPGAIDNAGGVALALALAKALASERPKRTVRFLFTAAEELGLRGSLHYVEAHEKELENIKAVINLDVHGQAIGTCSCIVTGNPKMATYAETLAKRMGLKVRVTEDVMSSDGTPFAHKGVPVFNMYRGGGPSHDMHTALDDSRYVHPVAFKVAGVFALQLLRELADAEEFPVPREVTSEMKKKVEEYFKKRGFGPGRKPRKEGS